MWNRYRREIFKEVEKTLTQYNLKQNMLRCVTTDGETMCSTEKDVVKTNLQTFKNCKVFIACGYSLHFHQKIFCRKNLSLFCIIEPICQ